MNYADIAMTSKRLIFQRQCKSDKECCICLKSLCNRSVLYTPCSHIFHSICLRKWQSNSNTCPICRELLPGDNNKRKTNDIDLDEILEFLMELEDQHI